MKKSANLRERSTYGEQLVISAWLECRIHGIWKILREGLRHKPLDCEKF